MSKLIDHAEEEFKAAWGAEDECEMQEVVKDNLRELLEVFSSQRHSGFSASYTLGLFDKLARYEAIAPLTGEGWEWVDVAEGLLQNKRDSRVFKNTDTGVAYFLDGKVFQEPNGACYTSSESTVVIEEWPYTPVTEYVNVEGEEGE